MSATNIVDPVQRMFAAVQVAGACTYEAKAPFTARWVVRDAGGGEIRFGEVTGNRLHMRGKIKASGPCSLTATRYVIVPGAAEPVPPMAIQEVVKPQAARREFVPPIRKPERLRAAQAVPTHSGRQVANGPAPQHRPNRRQILNEMEFVEIALSSMMRRWEGGISAEVRAEIMTEAYEPVLRLLIRSERRGHKRSSWRATA
jgi:hypothetical protein